VYVCVFVCVCTIQWTAPKISRFLIASLRRRLGPSRSAVKPADMLGIQTEEGQQAGQAIVVTGQSVVVARAMRERVRGRESSWPERV